MKAFNYFSHHLPGMSAKLKELYTSLDKLSVVVFDILYIGQEIFVLPYDGHKSF